MEKQLLFFDIDGTLLSNHTHEIPKSAIRAIEQAQKNGHLAFINTGRTIHTMPDVIRELPFDGFLCGCGTRIVYHDTTLLAHTFTKERGVELIDLMNKFDVETFLEGSDDVYCKREYRQPVMNYVKESFNQIGLGCTSYIDEKDFIYDKFIIMSDNQENTNGFIRAIEEDVDVIDRGKGMYECVPKGFSKASAMRILANYLNVPMAHTWAFGDSSNDLSMFQAAAHGVAMGEHSEVLEPYSEIIADTVENDGIAKVLKQVGLI